MFTTIVRPYTPNNAVLLGALRVKPYLTLFIASLFISTSHAATPPNSLVVALQGAQQVGLRSNIEGAQQSLGVSMLYFDQITK